MNLVGSGDYSFITKSRVFSDISFCGNEKFPKQVLKGNDRFIYPAKHGLALEQGIQEGRCLFFVFYDH